MNKILENKFFFKLPMNIKEVEQMTTKEKKKPFAALPTFHSSQHSRISGAPSDK